MSSWNIKYFRLKCKLRWNKLHVHHHCAWRDQKSKSTAVVKFGKMHASSGSMVHLTLQLHSFLLFLILQCPLLVSWVYIYMFFTVTPFTFVLGFFLYDVLIFPFLSHRLDMFPLHDFQKLSFLKSKDMYSWCFHTYISYLSLLTVPSPCPCVHPCKSPSSTHSTSSYFYDTYIPLPALHQSFYSQHILVFFSDSLALLFPMKCILWIQSESKIPGSNCTPSSYWTCSVYSKGLVVTVKMTCWSSS